MQHAHYVLQHVVCYAPNAHYVPSACCIYELLIQVAIFFAPPYNYKSLKKRACPV